MNYADGDQFLSYVLDKIRLRLKEVNTSIAEGQKEIENMHEYYWDNYTEMDQYGYENFDNQQALLTQINANEEQLKRRSRFRRMLDSPFFGRVDFQFEGEDQAEIFYIGIGNFAPRTGTMPLIYDWRAPVSGLFYDFDKGPASYEAPAGTVTGDITSKWQYKIRRGRMIYAFESDIKIDDEILGAELGGNGTLNLKNIVRTIQKEQNAIIRNTRDKVLVIQGCAGSGKTSIALHRIAYLLYYDRTNLKSSEMLILSPNSVFTDYISRILPELGEENIREMSFDIYAYRQLKDTVNDCEDRYDQIERTLKGAAQTTHEIKQSTDFINAMEGYMLMLEDDLMNFRDVTYKGVSHTESEIIDLFYFKFSRIPLLSRMNALAEYFIDEVETLLQKDLEEDQQQEIKEMFGKMYETRDLYVIYSRFLKEYGLKPLPRVHYEKRLLRYEDVYPMLYMKYSLTDQKADSRIKHLVVDEMQDYSRLQYLILNKMFSCKMTILGDRAQTMDDHRADVTTFLTDIFGRNIRIIEMKKSYRNTVEIASYANALAGITDIELFQRHGKPVEEKTLASREAILEDVYNIFREGSDRYETAAVILPTEAEAEKAYLYLKSLEGAKDPKISHISHMDRNSSRFFPGLTVTTFYMAKGLEFDRVFGIFAKEWQGPLITQAKYITATRALHELYIYDA